jgi:hypothetical protein
MPTTVRNLTADEQQKWTRVLTAIQQHTDSCATCQQSLDGQGMCAVGAALNDQWAELLR